MKKKKEVCYYLAELRNFSALPAVQDINFKN